MADQVIQRVFSGGEIAPGLRARSDLQKYITGLARCENFFVRSQGGAYTRAGTRFIGELDDMTKVGRLIPFSFNTEQTYILVFEHLKMRVIKDGGFVLDGVGPGLYELVTPYTEAQLSRLVFTQDADVMTITHPSHDPKNLSRLDHDDWTLANISYASSVTAPTGLAAASTGSAHGSATKDYQYVVTAVDEEGIESLPSSSATINIGSLTVTGGVRLTWTAVTGAQFYRVYKDPSNGSGVYGWIGDSKTNQFDDFNFLPITSDSPPADFLPFSGATSKPATVGYYQQRQVFANTTLEPQKVFMSQNGVYNSMRSSSPARDDDAIFFTIKANQVNEIRHIVSLNALTLLTSGGEWQVTEGQDMVLTPATLGVKRHSTWGSSWTMPAVVGDSVIFVQEKGSKIRDLNYEQTEGQYRGNELSIMSEHLFEDYQITEMTYALEPYGILWCVRDDGTMLGMTYQREHGVWAWHQHTTDGEFESVASINEDNRDTVYVIVKRTVNSNTVRYVERLQPRVTSSASDVWCLDCALSYDSTPATVFSGLEHLEGREVSAVADGNVVTGLTVTSGSITLPFASSKVTVGLPYTCVIETLDLDMGSQEQTFKGKEISVSRVLIEFEKSRGGWVSGRQDDGSFSEAMEIKPRFDSDGYDELALKSFKQEVFIQPSWNSSGGLKIEQRDPMPMGILAVVPDVDIS